MQHKIVLLLLAVLLLFLPIASATESITIASPSDLYTIEEADEVLTIDVTTSNSSMSIPYYKCTNDPGKWYPLEIIDNNRFLKDFDTSSLEDDTYYLSVKTSLDGVEYYDSITIIVDRAEAIADDEPEEEEQLSNISVSGLAENNIYLNNESFWISITNKETGVPIINPQLSIYQDQSSLKNTFMGTNSGLVKLQWLDFDGKSLSPDEYLISISKDGYNQLDKTIIIKNPEIATPEESAKVEKGELDINGIDLKIVVNGVSSLEILDDDTDEPIKDVAIKLKDQSSGTVLRTEYTDEFGRASIIWDISDTYTLGFTHPDYKSDSFTVIVTPPITSETTTTAAQETAPEVVEVEVPREPTPDDVLAYIQDTNALGDSKIYSPAEIEEIELNAVAEAEAAESQDPISQPVSASFEPFAPYVVLAIVFLIGAFFVNKYTTDGNFRDTVNGTFGKISAIVLKTKPSGDNPNFFESEVASAPASSASNVINWPSQDESTNIDVPVVEVPEPDIELNKEDAVESLEDVLIDESAAIDFLTPETKLKYLAESLRDIRPDQQEQLASIFRQMGQIINPKATEFADQVITIEAIRKYISDVAESTTNEIERMRVSAILEDFQANSIDDISLNINANSENNNGGVEAGFQ